MAAIKFKSALGVERMHEDGFGGIDRVELNGNCFLMKNLDSCADGSLKTRAGYTAVAEHEGTLRATFNFAGKLYSVIGDSLVITDIESGSSEAVAKLDQSEGDADIFCFGGDIYIHDGDSFFQFREGILTRVDGYAPLYGNRWHPLDRGTINEDINILSDRIRISYQAIQNTTVFYLGVKAASVDMVQINGETVDMSELEIRIDEDNASILHTAIINSASPITFWLTLSPESSEMHRIKQATNGFVFGNNGGERLCLYNPGISGYLYSSLPVSREEALISALSAPNALSLYVPASSALCIGSGASPITDLAHHYGRGILFTETDAWFIDWDGDEDDASIQKPKSFLLNSAIGAEHIRSSAYFDNDPITYFCGRLWRWHSASGVRDECSATLISNAVTELLPKDSEKVSMLSLPQKQKFFIADAEDSEGRIFVYDLQLKTWTVYKGIFAEKLLRYGNQAAFSRGGTIYAFFDDLKEDSDTDEVFQIKSRLVTHFFDFGYPERVKRSVSVLLEYDLSGGKGTLTLENEKGEKTVSPLRGKTDGGREQFSEHIRIPRFKKLRMTIETDSPAVIYSAIISAK